MNRASAADTRSSMSVNGAPPKYVFLADRLEGLIREGALTGRLPAVRTLAAEHKVSPVTATRALQALRQRGLVRSLERSGSYIMPEGPRPRRWALCLRLTPGPLVQASAEVALVGYRKLQERRTEMFLTDLFEFQEGRDVAAWSTQIRAAAEAGVSGVFFLPSRRDERSAHEDGEFLQACRLEGMPVVLIERNLRGGGRPLEWDLVCTDDLDGGRALTHHLLELGCRRIAFVTGSPTSSHDARLAGFTFALMEANRAGILSDAEAVPLVLDEPAHLSPKSAYRWLVDRLVEHEADGVFCYIDYTAVGVIVEALRRGVAVPRELAVVGFDNLPIGDTYAVGVTSYAPAPDAVAARALRVMLDRIAAPDAVPVKVSVPGRLIVRESSSAVPES